MGYRTNFKVNDDGSVTVENQLNHNEAAILEIFRVEKAKGGPLASIRMKRQAMKYAKGENVPGHVVERLMLDHYPKDFACYPKAKWLLRWLLIAIVFIACAGIMALGITYPKYEYYFEFKAFLLEQFYNNYDQQDLIRNRLHNMQGDFLYYLYCNCALAAVGCIGVWQCWRKRRQILKISKD